MRFVTDLLLTLFKSNENQPESLVIRWQLMQYVRSLDTTCYSNIIILQSPLSPASHLAILCVHRQHPALRQSPPPARVCMCARSCVRCKISLFFAPPSVPPPPALPPPESLVIRWQLMQYVRSFKYDHYAITLPPASSPAILCQQPAPRQVPRARARVYAPAHARACVCAARV